MVDDIQTVQLTHAEAMEMLWRQSQTIKRLQQENEKLREQYDAGVAAWNPVYEIVLNERDALKAENEKLRAALKECAQDLEAEINARYQIDGKVHPAEQRKYDRDMSTVRAAAAALKETE